MKTPQELLDEAIRQHPDINHTELGRRLGYKHPYQAVNKLVTGKKQFTPELQARIAEILGKPSTHFSDPNLTELRTAYIAERLREFRATDIGSRQSDDDMRLIERIGRAFIGEKLPTKALFEVIALTLEGGYTVGQLSAALDENTKRDRASATVKQDVLRRSKTLPQSDTPSSGRR